MQFANVQKLRRGMNARKASSPFNECSEARWIVILRVQIALNINELKNRIIAAFHEITVEMRMKTLLEYRERLYKIVENGGVHVEI